MACTPKMDRRSRWRLEQTYVLQRLVDDLRLLTLAETRQLPFDKRNVNIGDVIERVLEMFSAEAEEKNISLSFTEKSGDLSVVIDPQRFEQVLSNLIGNSLRYVPEGGRVWVTAKEMPDGLRITVNDNGAGIPDEDLPFIFDRFWRKDKSRSRSPAERDWVLPLQSNSSKPRAARLKPETCRKAGCR